MIVMCRERHSPHYGSELWEPPADLRTAMADLSPDQRVEIRNFGCRIVGATLPLSLRMDMQSCHGEREEGTDLLEAHLDSLMNLFVWACLERRDEQRESQFRPIEMARHVRELTDRVCDESKCRVGRDEIAEVVAGLHNIATLLIPDGATARALADQFVARYVEQVIGLYARYVSGSRPY